VGVGGRGEWRVLFPLEAEGQLLGLLLYQAVRRVENSLSFSEGKERGGWQRKGRGKCTFRLKPRESCLGSVLYQAVRRVEDSLSSSSSSPQPRGTPRAAREEGGQGEVDARGRGPPCPLLLLVPLLPVACPRVPPLSGAAPTARAPPRVSPVQPSSAQRAHSTHSTADTQQRNTVLSCHRIDTARDPPRVFPV